MQIGTSHATAVAEVVVETLAPVQKRYGELIADPATLARLLRAGAEAVRDDAARTVSDAREAIGLVTIA